MVKVFQCFTFYFKKKWESKQKQSTTSVSVKDDKKRAKYYVCRKSLKLNNKTAHIKDLESPHSKHYEFELMS